MRILFMIVFTALLIANLAFFVGMVRDCLRWLKRHRQGETLLPHLLITNPWLQTVGFLFLVNGLTHLYFTRKLS